MPTRDGSPLVSYLSESLVDSVDPKATNQSSLLLAHALEQFPPEHIIVFT